MPGMISKLLTRGKAIPWVRVYVLSEWAYRKGRAAHGGLDTSERSELGGLLRKSKGRRANLTGREVDRLRVLAAKAFDAARRA